MTYPLIIYFNEINNTVGMDIKYKVFDSNNNNREIRLYKGLKTDIIPKLSVLNTNNDSSGIKVRQSTSLQDISHTTTQISKNNMITSELNNWGMFK